MKTSITVFTLALLLAGSAAQGQISQYSQSAPAMQNSWQIGWGNSTVTATLNNGTLTISGSGQMYVQPSRYSSGFIPWYDQKDVITTVIIYNGVTNISATAFADHTNLRSISIPASVTSIGRSAFSNCSLTSITIPNSVTQIDDDAFSGNSGLTKVVLEDGKTNLKFGNYGVGNVFVNCPIDQLYLGRNMNWFNDFSVHGNSPFKNNTKLRSVTIGNYVTSIGGAAFYGCTDLTSVKLGNSITTIRGAAFQYTGITSITFPEGMTNIDALAFANSELTGIKIPAGVTSIGDDAFAACSRLKSVILEEGKVPLQFRDNPFNNSPIETLNIGRDIQGAWNFNKNTKLRSVTFGDKVTSISSSAFSGCSGLTRAIIGESITSVESYAFQYTELTDVLCKNPTPPTVGRDCFNGVNKAGCKLYITSGSQNAYKSANEWKDFFIVLNQATVAGSKPASPQPNSEATKPTQTTVQTKPAPTTVQTKPQPQIQPQTTVQNTTPSSKPQLKIDIRYVVAQDNVEPVYQQTNTKQLPRGAMVNYFSKSKNGNQIVLDNGRSYETEKANGSKVLIGYEDVYYYFPRGSLGVEPPASQQALQKPVIQSVTYGSDGIYLKGIYFDGTVHVEGIHTNTKNGQSYQEKYIDAHGNGMFDGKLAADKLEKGVVYKVAVVAIGDNGKKAVSDAWTINWLPQPIITEVKLVNGEIQFKGTYSNGTETMRVCHMNTKDNKPYWDGFIDYAGGDFWGSVSADKLAKGANYKIYVTAKNNTTGQQVASTAKSVAIPAPVVDNSGNSSSGGSSGSNTENKSSGSSGSTVLKDNYGIENLSYDDYYKTFINSVYDTKFAYW